MLKPNLIVLTDEPETVKQWIEGIVENAIKKALPGNSEPEATGNNLLSKSEACREFGITKTTLTEWMKKDIVPFVRLGRRIYFERHLVMAAGRSHTKYKHTK